MTGRASLRAALAGGAEFDDMTIITVRMGDLRALLADYDRGRDALEKVRPVIAADRQALLDTHGNGTEIPAADELGTLELYEYDGALHVIDAALTQERS